MNLYTVSSNAECPTKLRLSKLNEKNYSVSPINSNESDVDDSDADPNFSSSCDSSSSSVSSISDSAKELVEVEAEVEEPERKKGKKRQRNTEGWVTKRVKGLRNSGKTYVATSKSKK